MRKVYLRMNEQYKYEVIKLLSENKINKERASVKLKLSIRQVYRLLKKYKESGKSAFVHGNRCKNPAISLDSSLSNRIIQLYETKYQGFNFVHFKEMLESNENIKVSYTCIYGTLMRNGIRSPKIRRKTKRRLKKDELMKKKLLENKTKEEIEVIINNEVALEDSHPRRSKPKYFGEILEMDGSIHKWFGDKKTCLHLAVDRATNIVLGAFFDNQETLKGYYNVFKQILENYGIPAKFITDNRTIFNYNNEKKENRTAEKDVLTQFGYACKQLGVDLKTTSVSQAKGLVERTNGTFQGRLVNEFNLYNINTIKEANKYLINHFVPTYNKRFALPKDKFESVFCERPDDHEINYLLAVLTPRKIDNGNAIRFYNNYYQPYENDTLKCFMPRTSCLVIQAFDNDLLVSINDKVYELKKLEKNEKVSKEFDFEEPVKKKKKKKYIPPMHHPWKLQSFLAQMNRSHNKKIFA